MGLWCMSVLSVQENMGLLVGRDHLMFSLSLPSSAHLSVNLFSGSPRWALILMQMVSCPCSIRSRKSCTISLMMSASGFPHMEGGLLSPVHFWVEVSRHAESDRRIIGCLSFLSFASSSAKHATHNSIWFEEHLPLPSTVDSILLYFRLFYKSLPPWLPCCLIHLWRKLPLGRSRCPGDPSLCLVNVGSWGLLFQKKECLSSLPPLWLPGYLCVWPPRSCCLYLSRLPLSLSVWPVHLFPLTTSLCVCCFFPPPLPLISLPRGGAGFCWFARADGWGGSSCLLLRGWAPIVVFLLRLGLPIWSLLVVGLWSSLPISSSTFLKKGGMIRAVSPWYLMAWNDSFATRSTFQHVWSMLSALVPA